MRKSRVTWIGAYHHVMNRGINVEKIFNDDNLKSVFLKMLKEKSKKLRIRLFAYCIMDNHFHLVLENSSGRMSDFFRQLNGKFAMYYRKKEGGRGYVFQDRFKSTLIENDSYLITSILYMLLSPVRAGLVEKYDEYKWSSINEYFRQERSELIDSDFVNLLFGNNKNLNQQVISNIDMSLKIVDISYGNVLGNKDFEAKIEKKFERRKKLDAVKRRRSDDRYFEPVEKVIQEFEKVISMKIEEINIDSHHGKRLRGELLVRLKDLAGLKYKEIIELLIFSDLQYGSMGSLYKSTKKRINQQIQ
jgi:REP element-mobilizing transposase RayT